MWKHLLDRDCFPDEDRVVVDEAEMAATFYLYTATGQMAGYHVYKPNAPKKAERPRDAKYFTHMAKHGKHITPALYDFDCLDFSKDYLMITEGMFDHFTLKRAGFNSVPALNNNPQHLKNLLFQLPFKRIIAIEDGDSAGSMLSRVATHTFKCPNDQDPNDLGYDNMAVLLGEVFDDLD
jgi:hypothetical protein